MITVYVPTGTSGIEKMPVVEGSGFIDSPSEGFSSSVYFVGFGVPGTIEAVVKLIASTLTLAVSFGLYADGEHEANISAINEIRKRCFKQFRLLDMDFVFLLLYLSNI